MPGNCIHEMGSDKGVVNKDSFILLTPICTSKGPGDVDTRCDSGDYISCSSLGANVSARREFLNNRSLVREQEVCPWC